MAENLFTQLAQDTLAGLAAAPQTSGSSESTAGDDPVSAIVQVAQERGIDPAHLLGLAKLETRFGEKSVKGGGADTRNLFNVKDFSKAGNGIAARDNAEGSNDRYRQYGSYRESAEDLVGLLERKYPAALQARSPEEFAQALKQGGYATDPLYERKLANTIRSNSDRVAAVRPAVSAQEWDQGARYIPMESMVGTDKPKPAEEGVIDGVTSLGKAVWQGAKSLGRSVMASGNTAVGDLSDVELLAEAQKADAKNNPRAMMALQEEIAKRKEANPDAAWWQALGDVGDAAWKNKLGTAQLIANQAPNSAVALGGAWAGGLAGAKLGAVAAPFTGGLSVPVGAGLGALTGMFLGNYAMEAGGKALDKAEGGFTPEEARQSMTEGAKKAAVVTAVDTATLGAGKLLGRTVFGAPVRAGARAEAQVLANAGVDITNKAAIARAVANNQALKEAAIEAGKQAAKDASKFGTRAAQAGIDFGMETAGEGVGEYYGEVAATGKGDIYDAALEALSSASQSGVQTVQAMRSAEGNNLDPSGIVRAARQSGGIVSRAGLAATPGAQQPAGQPGQPGQPNQAGATTTTAGSTAVPGGNGAANAQPTANVTAAPNPYFDGVPDEGLESIWRNLTSRQTMTDGTPITDEDRKLGMDAMAELQRRRSVAAAQSNQPPGAGQQNAIQSSALSAIEQALEADKARKRAAGEVVEDDVVAKEAPKDARPSIIDPTSGELVKDGDPRYDMVLQAKGSAAPAMNTVAPTEAQTKGAKPGLSEESDPMLPQAIDVLRQGGRPSVSQIQGKLKIGFNRAARLLEEMEGQGIVSAMDEKGLRQILKLPDPPDAKASTPDQPAQSAGFSLPAFDNSPIPKMDPAAAEEQRRQAAEFEQKRKVRRAATRASSWDRNPFLAFLGANGINRDVANEFAPGLVEKRKAFVPGYGPVFRSGAKNLDELVQTAKEDGFLREDGDTTELYDLIERSLRGERIAPLYADGAAEAEGQRRQQEMMEREGATFEDYLQQAEADDFDPFPLMADSGYDAQDLAGTDFDQADDAVRAEVAALAAQYADLGFDPADVLESLSVETENQPEQAYYDRARTRLTDLISQAYAQAQPQGNRDVRADRAEPLPAGEAGARGPAAGQQVAPAAPTPRLRNVDELAAEGFNRVVKQGGKTYFVNPDTRESVELDSPAQIARARARVQAKQRLGSLRGTRPQPFGLDAVTPEALKARDEQAQAAQAQQTAEQQAAADKAKADDERKRIEQASYAAADNFQLGQNPLDSLTGQQDIFSAAPVDVRAIAKDMRETQAYWDGLHQRADKLDDPAVKDAQSKFESGEIDAPEFDAAIAAAEQRRTRVAQDLAGERINNEWTAFDPQSGTLGIPRAEMPQIKAEHRGAMVNFLKARGIDGQQETIPSAAIKPTQAEFSPAKVKQAMDYQGGNRSIIVSADGYVVDGHHQWLAAREKGEPIQAIRLDQNIGDVLAALKDMPSAQPEQGATSAQTYEQRNADRIARAQAADTQEAWDAITAEENADPERHFEGTDALRRAINARRLDLKPDTGSFAIYPDRQQDAETAATDSQYPLVTHTTKKGKVLRGYIVHGMTLDEVKASIDPYALKKDGGVFVREQHKDKLPKPATSSSGRGPAASQAWKDEGKSPADLIAEKAQSVGRELAVQVAEESREQDFRPSEIPQAVAQWAADASVPADDLKRVLLQELPSLGVSEARIQQIRAALYPASKPATRDPSAGRAAAGGQVGVNGYFYKGGQFLPTTMAEPGKWKLDGKWVTSGREEVAPREWGHAPTPFSRSIYAMINAWTDLKDGKLSVRDGIRDYQGNPVTPDTEIRPGVRGVQGQQALTLQELIDAWNAGQRWFDVQPNAETITTQEQTVEGGADEQAAAGQQWDGMTNAERVTIALEAGLPPAAAKKWSTRALANIDAKVREKLAAAMDARQAQDNAVYELPVDEQVFSDELGKLVNRQVEDGGEAERYQATFNPDVQRISLPRVTAASPKPAGVEFLPQAEADKIVQSWKDEAARQGQQPSSGNYTRTVISLFDASGVMSQPWEDAGYNVIRYDIQNGDDINDFNAETLLERHGDDNVWAVIAQPPCTDFASSGAQWWAEKDAKGLTEISNELVRQTMRTLELFRPPVWWLENPVGRMQRLNGLPDPVLSFDPWHFGDPWTKRTSYWGNFNPKVPTAMVEPVEGSKVHKLSSSAKFERSLTPEGVAYAMFMANNANAMTVPERLAREFPGIEAQLFERALAAGKTEQDIVGSIEDSFYENDLDMVREILSVPRKGEVGMKLASGEQVLTNTGRKTTPFPKVSLDTNRKASNTLKLVDRWLMQNALDEARSRGDDFNARQFEANLEKPQQADRDSAEEYLFGDFIPTVVPSILKPLTTDGGRMAGREGYDTPVALDAAQLKAILEQTRGEPLVDKPAKLEAWRNGTAKTDPAKLPIELFLTSDGRLDVNDGRHRIALAAERGEKVTAFIDGKDVQSVQDLLEAATTNQAAGPATANADLEAIFDQLDGLTQRTQANGQRAAAAHPQAERIQFVQKHILDILQDLEDTGKVTINC